MPLLCVLLAGCASNGHPQPTPSPSATSASSPIQHVVIIVQENRTVDNLFQFLPGANVQNYGMAGSQKVNLVAVPLADPWDISHTHTDFLACYAGGQMNGCQNEACAVPGSCPVNAAFSYVPQSDVQPYYDMAQQYGFADNFFSTQQGPSFPAHQYLLSGTSSKDGCNGSSCNWLRFSENGPAGCDAPPRMTRIALIDKNGSEAQSAFPCRTGTSLIQEADAASVSWNYYQNGQSIGLWHGPDALKYLCPNTPCNSNAEFAAHVISPPSQALTDIGNGKLAAITWVTPTDACSDHSAGNTGCGPSWVASVVNAIGNSPFWGSTAIFITWDDWGGWYDHVTPTVFNSYEDGLRVPLIAISPYAKAGYISHTAHEFGSILKYAEETFGLPSMGTSDARADDLSDMFDYTQQPIQFTPIAGSMPVKHWLQMRDDRPVDD